MRLVDLTRLLDPRDAERLPPGYEGAATNLCPRVEHIEPAGEGAEVMCGIFGCDKHDLPAGEGWGDERIRMSTHLGTHVDAPLHYGSTCEGKPARTITDIDIGELYCEAMVLDLRGKVDKGRGIAVEALREALAANGGTPTPGCAILLRTGQEAFDVSHRDFFYYPGMTRAGTLFLAELGAKVLGTDALGWDRPFGVMRRAFERTGDAAEIWDGHFAGREREVFIVQQLTNLDQLPPHGFRAAFFPMKLARCSAAPARAVAFLD